MINFGIEEEYLLIDPGTGMPAGPTTEQSRMLSAVTGGGATGEAELLTCQVEMATPICSTGPEALDSLRTFRLSLADAVGALGLNAVAIGTAPQMGHDPARVSDVLRYRQIEEHAAGIVSDQYINGMHIHVEVPNREAGVAALNGVRKWIPVLTALAANSPIWKGFDSGFASWRTIHYRRWSIQGVPPHFAGPRDYDRRVARLMSTDAILDLGHVGWSARLSAKYPTIELRAPDVQLTAADAVLVALLVRAMVMASFDDAGPEPSESVLLPEILDVANWQAARFGLAGNLVDPVDGSSRSSADSLWALFHVVEPYLAQSGDADFVEDGLRRVLARGNGARQQREVYRDAGLRGVVRFAAEALVE